MTCSSPAATKVISKFEGTSGYAVKLISDPEDRVFRRMKLSKHADLYLSITPKLIERARDLDLSKDDEVVCLIRPALITAPLNPLEIDSVDKLKDVDIRLGIDKRDTTLGIITKQLFEKNGFDWEEVCQAVYLPAESETELVEGIRNGMIDVAVIWKMVAMEAERVEYVEIDPKENASLPVMAMELDKSEHPQAVADLIAFMKSPEGQKIWEKFGFTGLKEVDQP